METFWRTIGLYNSSTWVYQIIIIIVGVGVTLFLYYNPGKLSRLLIKLFLVFVNTWIAVVYYLVYCQERSYNGILALFWGVMALFWLYDIVVGHTSLERSYRYDKLSWFLYLMPFVYPLFSLIRGLRFPEMTSPVMPCSVAVYTIGLLLAFSKKVNLFIILFLTHWALIGLSKVYFFNIPEDFMLASAAVPALYLFFKEYFNAELHKDRSPKARLINMSLIVLCILIGLTLTVAVFCEIYTDVK